MERRTKIGIGVGVAIALILIIVLVVVLTTGGGGGSDDSGSVTNHEDVDSTFESPFESRLMSPSVSHLGRRLYAGKDSGTWSAHGDDMSVNYVGENPSSTLDGLGISDYYVREGKLYKNAAILHSDAKMRRVIHIGSDRVWVIANDGLYYWSASSSFRLYFACDAIDAYIHTNVHAVIVTGNQVYWIRDGREVAHDVVHAASVTEISGEMCFVGVPTNEEVRMYNAGVLLDSVEIPGTKGNTEFGYALSYQHPNLIIGAPSEEDGVVYRYSTSMGPLIPFERIEPEEPTDRSRFGASVLIHNDSILVGAPDYADGKGCVDVLGMGS